MPPERQRRLKYEWRFWARPEQLAPEGSWRVWIIIAGRGWGKTRTGAEWLIERAQKGYRRLGMIGQTAADVRDTMIQGEALALDTLIPTPGGWRAMGDLEVGDLVFNEEGTPTRIVATSPIRENRPCYRVEFNDGATIVADGSHRWLTSSWAARNPETRYRGLSDTPHVVTTEQIADSLMHGNSRNHSVPLCRPLQYEPTELPMHPYVLGVWLGDGTAKDGSITCNDPEIVSHVERCGYRTRKRADRYGYGILGISALLRRAGLLRNKHIPEAYLHGSVSDRQSLLAGLMDTDGYISREGQCAFDNTNSRLVEQVFELLVGLGFRVNRAGVHQQRFAGKECQPVYRLTFTPPAHLPVFWLSRKEDRRQGKTPLRSTYRLVKSVTPVESVPVKCIQVESPSHLYLCGWNCIPTHNSGLLTISAPWFMPRYEPSKRLVTFPNGAKAHLYSGDEPDQLRGPAHDSVWADEPAKWKYASEAWYNMDFGLRSGPDPKVLGTTTPRPIPLILTLLEEAQGENGNVIVTTGNTFDNSANLAPGFLAALKRRYVGTRLGRQELFAEILRERAGSLWTRTRLEELRVKNAPPCGRILIGVDPAMSDGENAAETGIVVVGRGPDGHGYTLRDGTVQGSPGEWAQRVARLYQIFSANAVVAEGNQGGNLVAATIQTVNPLIPIKIVHASRSKEARAEPVAALYEKGEIHHVGMMAELEDQLVQWAPGDPSPDRLDAMVWAYTELFGLGVERLNPLAGIISQAKTSGWFTTGGGPGGRNPKRRARGFR